MNKMTLRPHHLLCLRFRPAEFSDRPGEFLETERQVKAAIDPESGFIIRLAEGVDFHCRACSNCGDGRCDDPKGNEEAMRQRDMTIMKDLGVSYGTEMTSKEWGDLIAGKAPLGFCLTECPVGADCPGPSGKTA